MDSIRILWLINEPLPDFANALGLAPKIGGSWMVALSKALVSEGCIKLGVASRVPFGDISHYSIDGVEHYSVPTPKKGYGVFLRPTAKMLHRYREIISDFSPDVIHVHGTEWYGGIVTADNRMGRPTVISIQGLIDHHIRHLTGQLEFSDILKSRTLRNWIVFDGLLKQKAQWRKRAQVEREIIRNHQAYIGRTLWDRAHLRRLNENASYFHCHEMVRTDFFKREWRLDAANRHTVFAPSAAYPLKGFHVLLKAIALLRREFPDVKVRVPLSAFATHSGCKGRYESLRRGNYENYLVRLINRLDLNSSVLSLGRLSPEQMADEMSRAHVFALNSFVENSPNTLAEALTMGVPCVASLAGGIPSLIRDGESVLAYPVGDEAVLAEQIRNIFIDDELAIQLSQNGKKTARPRHSPEPIVQRMIDIYRSIKAGNYSLELENPVEVVPAL